MSASQPAVVPLIRGVERRLALARALRFVAAFLPLLAVALAWARLGKPAFGLVVLVIGIGVVLIVERGASRRRPSTALLIEQRHPAFENVLVSAAELLQGTLQTSDQMRALVLAEAERRVAAVRPADIVLLGPSIHFAAGSAILSIIGILLLLFMPPAPPRAPRTPGTPPDQRRSQAPRRDVQVRVVPPAYLRQPARELRDPERVDAIEGSTLEVTATGGQLRWTEDGHVSGQPSNSLRFRANRAGFLGLEADGRLVRVIPVNVSRDNVPTVTVAAPKGDLLLSAPGAVAITGTAADDHALVSAELRYTRVSGSGEQFEFRSGVVPVRLEKSSEKAWSIRAALRLREMGATAGDTIVYRLAARDGRGAAGEGLSDALVVEIAAPGHALTAGAEMDPTEDRFAISQQMIVLKLRRLHRERGSLGADELLERSQALAGEQRSVRALVVFMVGGEVEDEEVEAAHSHEIQEGRLEESGRQDLMTAINLMSRVEERLLGADTRGALPPAEAAVEAVQRAFGRRRYFLRSAPARMQIDPSRRLTGDLAQAQSHVRTLAGPRMQEGERSAIETLIAGELVSAAAMVIALDPRDPELQRLAQRLQASAPQPVDMRRAAIQETLAVLAQRIRAREAGELDPAPASSSLRSAWAEAWRERQR